MANKTEVNKMAVAVIIFVGLFLVWHFWPHQKLTNKEYLKNLHTKAAINMQLCIMTDFKDETLCPITPNTTDGGLEFIKEAFINNPILAQEGVIEYKGNFSLNNKAENYENPQIILKIDANQNGNYEMACVWTIDGKMGFFEKKEVVGGFNQNLCNE